MDNISYFKNNNLLVIRRYNEDKLVRVLINFSNDKSQSINLTDVSERIPAIATTKITNLQYDDKNLFFSKGQDGYIVVVPKKTPIILHSTYQLFNGSKKYTNYLLTI
ncbi:hypothetical protein HZH66_009535 [Vespula vulgaris]|uniref:Uncharacterized protein n=1 Tax=Vespula vulgaris TaxID=7454 RepID=A0A834N092_VESVU|nr:hypothetical protein HZH66_009535 [Vespula vulgaris]